MELEGNWSSGTNSRGRNGCQGVGSGAWHRQGCRPSCFFPVGGPVRGFAVPPRGGGVACGVVRSKKSERTSNPQSAMAISQSEKAIANVGKQSAMQKSEGEGKTATDKKKASEKARRRATSGKQGSNNQRAIVDGKWTVDSSLWSLLRVLVRFSGACPVHRQNPGRAVPGCGLGLVGPLCACFVFGPPPTTSRAGGKLEPGRCRGSARVALFWVGAGALCWSGLSWRGWRVAFDTGRLSIPGPVPLSFWDVAPLAPYPRDGRTGSALV